MTIKVNGREKAVKVTAKSLRYGLLAARKVAKGVVAFVADVNKEIRK